MPNNVTLAMIRLFLLLGGLLLLPDAFAQSARPPFFRHEVNAHVGVTGDDFGGSIVYENRYTYFMGRRLGLTGGLSLMRSFEDETSFLPQAYNLFSVAAGVRLLPLTSGRHRIGLNPALMYMHWSGIEPSFGRRSFDPASTLPAGLLVTRPEIGSRQAFGWQVTAEYEFLPTPRLPLGGWLRIAENPAYDIYAAFGIQIGYRF